MAISNPQFDLPLGISGGADVWDDGLAGILLSADYFDAVVGPSSWTLVPTGSISFVGTAPLTLQKNIVIVPSGSVVFSGTAPITLSNGATSWTVVPTGNVLLTGTTALRYGKVQQVSGSVILQGTVPISHGRLQVVTGTVYFSGTTSVVKTKNYLPQGNIQMSGTAPITSNTVVETNNITHLPLTFAGKT